jgi:hypothetical protein
MSSVQQTTYNNVTTVGRVIKRKVVEGWLALMFHIREVQGAQIWSLSTGFQ